MCLKLRQALKVKMMFDVSGGCGIDTSNGDSRCMDRSGLWFKFCPFCGKEIKSWRDKIGWDWEEIK